MSSSSSPFSSLDLLPPHLKLKILNLSLKENAHIEDKSLSMSSSSPPPSSASASASSPPLLPLLTLPPLSSYSLVPQTDTHSLSPLSNPLSSLISPSHLSFLFSPSYHYFFVDNILSSSSPSPFHSLSPSTLRSEILFLHKNSILIPSKMKSHQGESWTDNTMRNDFSCFWGNHQQYITKHCPSLSSLIDSLSTSLLAFFNSVFFPPFNSLGVSVQISYFLPSDSTAAKVSHYVRHLDSTGEEGKPKRRITVILYLNEEWKQEDGGNIRLFNVKHMDQMEKVTQEKEKETIIPLQPSSSSSSSSSTSITSSSDSHVDLPPLSGRLLVFDSRIVEHEVRNTKKERFAITFWIQ